MVIFVLSFEYLIVSPRLFCFAHSARLLSAAWCWQSLKERTLVIIVTVMTPYPLAKAQ
jgi:hypothetical protein